MKSKRPANKKNAPTPAKGKKRGPYKKKDGPRGPYSNLTSSHNTTGEETNINSEEDEFFKIESFSGIVNYRGFRMSSNYQKMVAAIKKLKPQEGFIIKSEWKHYPHKVREELKLDIHLRIVAVPGNDKVRRVVRLM